MNRLSKVLLAVVLFTAIEGQALEIAEPQKLDLYEYQPIYLVVGHPYAKIQLSAKTGVVRDVPLYFAYTQLMMWDIFSPAPNMHDVNYQPEIFYRHMISTSTDQWLDIGIYNHESNGLGVNGEKAWDRSYLRYHTLSRLGDQMSLHWDLSAWVPYNYGVNVDLPQYRGVWQVDVTLTDFVGHYFERGELEFRFYPGGQYLTNPIFGGQELTFRAKLVTFLPLIVMQAFHGYGENLLDFNHERFAFRAGIGF